MIPKVIHYCWFGGNPKPKSVMKCIASWKNYCPDYEIIEWNESNLDISANEYTRQAYEVKAWGFVPDYLRLWIVYTYGGIYLDTDVQIVRSFDPLLNEEGFAGFEDNEHISFGLGFGAEAGNKLLEKHMQIYDTLHFLNEDGSYNRTPSPEYITAVMNTMGFRANDGSIQRIDGFACYPPEYFCPKSFESGIIKCTKNTFSIHHFDASWCSDEQNTYREKRWTQAKRDYYSHIPNRVLKKLLGDKKYYKLKQFIRREN